MAAYPILQPTRMRIMSDLQHDEGASVQRRTDKYQPRRSWRTWLIGRPLPTADAPHQTIGKDVGLAVFASDALSSTAYATQEMLFILAGAGMAAFVYAFPISIVIVVLLAIVTLSYEQIIHAYPGGGGAYIVARDNLGELPAQVAGAALLTDYILTVAVSISSGVAQIISAFPGALRLSRGDRGRVGAVHDGGQPPRRAGIGRGLRHPQLLLPGDDGGDGVYRADPLPDWLARAGGGSAADGDGSDHAGGLSVPDPACVFQRHDRAHRRGGDLKRHHGLQGAAQPQRRHHADLDVVYPGRALPGHHLSVGPDRRSALGNGDGDLATGAHGVRRPQPGLPGPDWGHDGHPGDGCQHLVRRFPAAERAAGCGWLSSAPTGVPRQPAGLLARHRRPGADRLPADHRLSGQRHRPDPTLCHRRLPLLHPVAGRHGAALVEGRPRGPVRRSRSVARPSATSPAGEPR